MCSHLPVCETLPDVSWAQPRQRWPEQTGPSGQRRQRRGARSRGRHSSCVDSRRRPRIPLWACLSWSRSSYLRSRYGTRSRKPYRMTWSGRVRRGLGKDGVRRTLQQANQEKTYHTGAQVPLFAQPDACQACTTIQLECLSVNEPLCYKSR